MVLHSWESRSSPIFNPGFIQLKPGFFLYILHTSKVYVSTPQNQLFYFWIDYANLPKISFSVYEIPAGNILFLRSLY